MYQRVRLGANGRGPVPLPDPMPASSLPGPEAGYAQAFDRWHPLLMRSGERGVVSRPTSWRPARPAGGGVPGGLPADVGALAGGDLLSEREPWLFAPWDSFPLELFANAVAVPVGGTSNIISMAQLPRGTRAVFKRFANQSTDLTNTAWNFLIRGRPVAPVANMTGFQYGQLFDPRPLPGPGVTLDSGDDFVVQVTNLGLAAITVSARVQGYQWATRGGRR